MFFAATQEFEIAILRLFLARRAIFINEEINPCLHASKLSSHNP